MRRSIAVLSALTVLTALAAPAVAGKGKHVHGTFGGTLLPFPNYSSATATATPGCSAGQQDVHWVGQEFTSPGKGNLRFYTEGFTGDWDLYVFDGDIAIARSDADQTSGGAPAEEEVVLPMKPKQKVLLVVCNWLGSPEVEAHFEGMFK